MLEKVRHYKVEVLPSVLHPNSFYYVKQGTYADFYLTDDTGIPVSVGGSAATLAYVSDLIEAAVGRTQQIFVSATITDRNLRNDPGYDYLVVVMDASGDPTVRSGAAAYTWNASTQVFTKITESESIDVSVEPRVFDGGNF